MKQTKAFCKSRNCPTTETLLLFLSNKLESEETEIVTHHLDRCEFCCAELQLLGAYSPPVESCATPEIPFPLRQLAEIMLSGKRAEFQFLHKLFREPETFPQSKAIC